MKKSKFKESQTIKALKVVDGRQTVRKYRPVYCISMMAMIFFFSILSLPSCKDIGKNLVVGNIDSISINYVDYENRIGFRPRALVYFSIKNLSDSNFHLNSCSRLYTNSSAKELKCNELLNTWWSIQWPDSIFVGNKEEPIMFLNQNFVDVNGYDIIIKKNDKVNLVFLCYLNNRYPKNDSCYMCLKKESFCLIDTINGHSLEIVPLINSY